MLRLRNWCLYGMLLTTVTVGCAQSPTDPTTVASAANETTGAAKPGSSLPQGFYQMTFLDNSSQVVTTLPVGAGSTLRVKVHVEDSNHQVAVDGTVFFEQCRWKGVSPTTGTRGGAAPSSACANGTARWERFSSMEIRPGGNGNAVAGIDRVNVPCVMGWRATYKNSGAIAPATMGPMDITWQ